MDPIGDDDRTARIVARVNARLAATGLGSRAAARRGTGRSRAARAALCPRIEGCGPEPCWSRQRNRRQSGSTAAIDIHRQVRSARPCRRASPRAIGQRQGLVLIIGVVGGEAGFQPSLNVLELKLRLFAAAPGRGRRAARRAEATMARAPTRGRAQRAVSGRRKAGRFFARLGFWSCTMSKSSATRAGNQRRDRRPGDASQRRCFRRHRDA